jgi:hypothetical protein
MVAEMSFLHRAFEMQRREREPQTELEKVLFKYSWANSGQVLDIVIDNWRVLRDAGLV